MPQTGLFALRLQMNSNPLRILLDRGSPFTSLSQVPLKKIGSPLFSPISICANTYSGDQLTSAGDVITYIQFHGKVFSSLFGVSKTSNHSILGCNLTFLLNLDTASLNTFLALFKKTRLYWNIFVFFSLCLSSDLIRFANADESLHKTEAK